MIHYKSDGILDATIDKVWKYLLSDDHKHKVFTKGRVLSESEDQFTLEVDVVGLDGKTTERWTATHRLNPPDGFETYISGGMFDGARVKHKYTPMGSQTKVELEGDFPQRTDESTQWKAIDDFYTTMFNEDNANIKRMK